MKDLINGKKVNLGDFLRASLLIVSVFLVVEFLNLASVYTILVFAVILAVYIFFKEQLWIFLVFSAPLLVLGQVARIPVSVNWVYEATLMEVAILLVAIVFFSEKFISGKIKSIQIDTIGWLLLAYLGYSLLSFFEVLNMRLFVFGIKIPMFSLLAYVLALNLIDSKRKIESVFRSLMVFAAILSLQVILKLSLTGWSSKFVLDRSSITVTLGAIATVSSIIVTILPMLLAYFYSLKKISLEKIFFLGAFFLGVTAIFIMTGKAAIGSLIVGLIFLFYRLKDRRKDFVLFSLLFLLASFMFLNSFFEGLLGRFHEMGKEESFKFRALEYKTSWEIIRNNYRFGVGAGQHFIFFQQKLNWNNPQMLSNYFMQSLMDAGIAGLLLSLKITWDAFKKSIQGLKKWPDYQSPRGILAVGIVSSFIVAFMVGQVETTFFAQSYAMIFWMIAGFFSNLEKYE